ncbi:MAG: hypothetical protein NDJ89_04220 [Oligoflexia bacterium]|nr:hypothetical protein [Oligoflexia bacterium]
MRELLRDTLRAGLIVLLQLCWALLFTAPSSDLDGRVRQLVNWDSFRYRDIAELGYRIPGPEITSGDIHEGRANVVFFPGYPLTARAVAGAFGLSIDAALLLVAHLSCLIFWLYFIRLLRFHGVPGRTIAWSCFLIALHPAAFFLVAGYTEPLFLAGLLGLIYWTDRWVARGASGFGSAGAIALHGAVMSATRIVSFAMVPYPAFRQGFLLGWPPSLKLSRKQLLALGLGLFCTIGAIAFFAWCQQRFGEWNLYFRLEEIGWRNHRRWFAVLDPLSYIPRFFFEHTVNSFNRAAMPFTALLFYLAWKFEKDSATTRERLGMYFSAFMLYYIPLTGKANADMDSMIRYTLPTYILITCCLARLQTERFAAGKGPLFTGAWRVAVTVGAIVSVAIQGWFAYRFVRGKWVA